MADVLRLTFLTTGNQRVTVNVPRPYRLVSEETVRNAMAQMIASGALFVKNSHLSSAIGAELIQVTPTTFNV